MARTFFYTNEQPTETQSQSDWRAGLYIRLSHEDADERSESNSITNQRYLLVDYAAEQTDIFVTETYVDDGYSGINFDRPGFQNLIRDINESRINCVIVKDLSRFSRDMTGIRGYLEELFPSLNCRFISVIDNLDSFKRPQDINSIFVQFKHLMNEHYCREISQKTRETFDSMRRDGKLVSAFAPYGYKKDLDNHQHLVIDEEVSQVVKDIYAWFIEGMGIIRIAQKLNDLGVLSPTMYRKKSGGLRSENSRISAIWLPDAVRYILKSKTYIGALEQKKTSSLDYRSKKKVRVEESKRIIAYKTHEPIISESDFDLVRRKFERCTYTGMNQTKCYLFSGFLRCTDCNRAMMRYPKKVGSKVYVYYKCRTYYQISKDACPHPHSIRYETLCEIVFQAIKSHIYAVANLSNILDQICKNSGTSNQIRFYEKELSQRRKEIQTKNRLKAECYDDWKSNLLNSEEYLFMKKRYDKELDTLSHAIIELEKKKSILMNMRPKDMEWMKAFAKHYNASKITRPMLLSMVNVIYISRDKTVRIKFNFQDDFDKLAKLVEENSQPLQVYQNG